MGRPFRRVLGNARRALQKTHGLTFKLPPQRNWQCRLCPTTGQVFKARRGFVHSDDDVRTAPPHEVLKCQSKSRGAPPSSNQTRRRMTERDSLETRRLGARLRRSDNTRAAAAWLVVLVWSLWCSMLVAAGLFSCAQHRSFPSRLAYSASQGALVLFARAVWFFAKLCLRLRPFQISLHIRAGQLLSVDLIGVASLGLIWLSAFVFSHWLGTRI